MGNPVVHFDIRSTHPEELWPFYREVFEWRIEVDPEDGYGLTFTDAGRGIDGGIGASEEGPGVTVYVEVRDIDATLRAIEGRGGKTVLPRAESPAVTVAQFADPHGNVIGLVETKAEG